MKPGFSGPGMLETGSTRKRFEKIGTSQNLNPIGIQPAKIQFGEFMEASFSTSPEAMDAPTVKQECTLVFDPAPPH